MLSISLIRVSILAAISAKVGMDSCGSDKVASDAKNESKRSSADLYFWIVDSILKVLGLDCLTPERKMNSEVSLSSLSGEELLSILRESLAKKKVAQGNPVVRSTSASTLIEEDEILQPVPVDDETDQQEILEEGMVLESGEQSPDRQVTNDDQMISGQDGSIEKDGLGFSPEEFLRDVLSHPPSVAELSNNFPDAQNAFYLGKLSAYLSYDSSFASFYSNLSSRLEDLKKVLVEKKKAWQDSKEHYRVLKEEIDVAIKKMEIKALDYKDAEQDKVVLDSILDWITRVKDKSVLKSESTMKELGAFGKNIPSSWNEIVGPHALAYINNYNSSASSTKPTPRSNDAAKSPQSDSKSKDYSEEKKAVFSRLGSKNGKRSIDEICEKFNKNSCSANNDSCKNLHICLYCNGPHPVTSCGPSKATERILCVQWNVDEVVYALIGRENVGMAGALVNIDVFDVCLSLIVWENAMLQGLENLFLKHFAMFGMPRA